MKFNLFLLILLAVFLSACAPAQSEPIVAPPSSENIDNETALQSVPPTPTLAPKPVEPVAEDDPMPEPENDDLQEMPAPQELSSAEGNGEQANSETTTYITVEPAGEVNMSDAADKPNPPSTTPRIMPAPGTANQNQPPPGLEGIFPKILADLATRVGQDPPPAQLTNVDEVTWSDGSIGCPQEGMMYTMALVDGFRLTFLVDGAEYTYHTDNGRLFTYCENKNWQSKTTTNPGFGSDK